MPVIRPHTRQFTSFSTNITYARNLITAGQSLATLQVAAFDIGDLYRAAWVQAVSALDHWVHEELYARVAALAADTGPGMPKQLQKFELPLAVVEQVRLDNLQISDAVLNHIKSKWSFQSLQNPRMITEALKLITDEDVWGKAANLINQEQTHSTNLSGADLRNRLQAIVERRNQIAHYADLEDGSLKVRRQIDASAVFDAVALIEEIAEALAAVLGRSATRTAELLTAIDAACVPDAAKALRAIFEHARAHPLFHSFAWAGDAVNPSVTPRFVADTTPILPWTIRTEEGKPTKWSVNFEYIATHVDEARVATFRDRLAALPGTEVLVGLEAHQWRKRPSLSADVSLAGPDAAATVVSALDELLSEAGE